MMTVNRRDLILSAATAGLALGIPKPFAFLGAAPAQAKVMADDGFFKWKVGDAELTAVFDGEWAKDHDPAFITGVSVEDTKKALADAGLPNDKVHIPFTVIVANIGGKLVMFDSGTGGQMSPDAGKLAANMAKAGLDMAKVQTVIITHIHPDHVFGLMAKDTNALTMPNAEIVVGATEYKFWTDPALVGKVPDGFKPFVQRVQATFPTWKNVRQVDGEAEIVPGIRSLPTFGHTPGHTSFQLSSGGKVLYVLGDVSSVPALFMKHPEWHVMFDSLPDVAEKTRRAMADRAIAEGAQVAGYHYPFPAAGTFAKDGNGYVFNPAA